MYLKEHLEREGREGLRGGAEGGDSRNGVVGIVVVVWKRKKENKKMRRKKKQRRRRRIGQQQLLPDYRFSSSNNSLTFGKTILESHRNHRNINLKGQV